MSMENSQIADVFEEIADLLDLQDANSFRIRSYRRAAQSIRNLSDRLEDKAAEEKDFSAIPDVGESSAKKIHEMLEKGTCKRLEELRKKVPSGLPELMHIPKLGPQKAKQLNKELGIKNVKQLQDACEQHKVRELDGMGAKTEENILDGIKTIKKTEGRLLYAEADEQLQTLADYLNGLQELKQWEVAGSFRRGKETIGDLDILVQAQDRSKAVKKLLEYSSIADIIGKGKEKVSVRLSGGLQVDFRFFDSGSFGAALMYFTGSKAHNIKLRKMAQQNDWKLNEYGLSKDKKRLAGKTEQAVYKRFGMVWIPPELRENRGELEAAQKKNGIPKLVEQDELRGDLHCHTKASDGRETIKAMAEAAQAYGYDYLAITDHSKRVRMANGLDDEAMKKHADAIRKVDEDLSRFWLLAGVECDILKSGKLDLKEKTLEPLDWVVASVHYDRAMSRKAMTDRLIKAISSGVVHCIGHPTGRMIGKRDELPIDFDRLFSACVEHDVYIEINAQPERQDLPDVYCREAAEHGVKFAISTDAHSSESFPAMAMGVNVARRGWLRKRDIINTKTLSALRKELQ
jgi:DNA polymerase (family 10)